MMVQSFGFGVVSVGQMHTCCPLSLSVNVWQCAARSLDVHAPAWLVAAVSVEVKPSARPAMVAMMMDLMTPKLARERHARKPH